MHYEASSEHFKVVSIMIDWNHRNYNIKQLINVDEQ